MSNDDCLKDKWENCASAPPDTNQIILEMFFPWHGTQENNPKQNETTQGGHTSTLKSLMSLSTKKKSPVLLVVSCSIKCHLTSEGRNSTSSTTIQGF